MAVRLEDARKELQEQSRRRVELAIRRMTDDMKRTAPVDTGNLQRRSGVEIQSATTTRITAFAQADTDYAEYVNFGTRAHVIRPRNARALRFQVAGRTVFAMKVNHPGSRPNPFFTNVVKRWREYLQTVRL